MNTKVKVSIAALFLATAALAHGQTPTGSLAERESFFQSASGTGAVWHPTQPAGKIAADPSKGLSESQFQALSNEDPVFQPNRFSAEQDRSPSFAKLNPRGLPESFYQGASSSDGLFGSEPLWNVPNTSVASPGNPDALANR